MANNPMTVSEESSTLKQSIYEVAQIIGNNPDDFTNDTDDDELKSALVDVCHMLTEPQQATLEKLRGTLASLCVVAQTCDLDDEETQTLYQALDQCRDQFPCAVDEEDEEDETA